MKAWLLEEVREAGAFGGKAAGLGAALRAGFRVPRGLALDVDTVEALAAASEPAEMALELCARLLEALGGGPLAVRSSALGEDSESASFAGQHLTRLNVSGVENLLAAVRAVRDSGRAPSALAYRRKLGLDEAPRVAVVVQRMVHPETAGVLFTRNPVSGADERVVEASWGLGESVVAGLVTPDRWRFRRGGEIVDHAPGDKDVEILPGEGGTEERPVDPARARRACLDESHLRALDELASRCESHFEGASDLEWAFARETEGPETLYLLQRRPVTR